MSAKCSRSPMTALRATARFVLRCARVTEIRLQHSPAKHLLLDMLVAIASMPSTLGIVYLGDTWNLSELAQLGLLSLGAGVQVLALFAVARFFERRRRARAVLDA